MTKRIPGETALPGMRGRPAGTVARVRRGVEHQLNAQRAAGQLEPVDDGLVALARTLADAAGRRTLRPRRFPVHGRRAGRPAGPGAVGAAR